MSKTGRTNPRRADREAKRRKASTRGERKITVRSEKRTPPDLYKLSRAVIAIALAEADADTDSEKTRSNRKEDRHDD
ncbi:MULTISPECIES: hypothetical protein [Nocardia]|uniref:hypothetical protein n=1 Tax=Nocardia TaxID=1817 RepID=UPI000A47CFE2|nr:MULTISPECIES: hypothetical protein [Nocardia]MBF6276396.1 hypothetical protein [Nocardia nova]